MAFSAIITLASAGADAGPFDLYSDATIPAYGTAFETGISKADLLLGYISSVVPDGTAVVRVTSTGACTNHVDIAVDDPSVEVYLRCGSAFYYWILTSAGVDTAKAQDSIAHCYTHEDAGPLSVMLTTYPGMTENLTLISSTCACV